MQKTTEKLSAKRAAKAEPTGKRYFVFDSAVNGFGLVVQPSGAKAFIFQYRDRQGNKRRIKIGDYGPLTVDQARDIARKHYAEVSQGNDPRELAKQATDVLRVTDLIDRYLQSGAFAKLATTTRKCDVTTYENHIRPLIGRLEVDRVTKDDLERMSLDIANGKTAGIRRTGLRGKSIVKGGPGAAQTCLRKIKAVFSWAVAQNLTTNHPGLLLKAGQNGRRKDVLDDDGYARIFRAMDEMEEAGELNPTVGDALRVIALTAARRSEIIDLRWRQVDLNARVIVLGKGEHKTGHGAGSSEKTIVLPAQACTIIARQPKRGPDDRVFKSSVGDGSGLININKPWLAIRAKAGVSDRLVPHSLRHSLASYMANNNHDALAIQAVLGHKQIQTSMIYIHMSKDTHQKHADAAGAAIANFMIDPPAADE